MFRLYFFHQPGCGYCAMARPDAEQFQLRHPEGIIIYVHRGLKPEVAGFKPSGTPAYLLLLNEGQTAFTHVGALTLKELEAALKEARREEAGEPETKKRKKR